MARAAARAAAKKFIPFGNCDNHIAGINDWNMGKLIEDALSHLTGSVTES
jgi:hypothetical protein